MEEIFQPRVLFLQGNTVLATEKIEELYRTASEAGFQLLIYRNFSAVGKKLNPLEVVCVVTLNHEPTSIPAQYSRRPVIKITLNAKYAIPQIIDNKLPTDGCKECIYKTSKINIKFLFKLIERIWSNKKIKKNDQILFLTGRTKLNPKDKDYLRILATGINCDVYISRNFSDLSKNNFNSRRVVLIACLNYVPEIMPEEYLTRPTSILYIFSSGKSVAERINELKVGKSNILTIKQIDPTLIFQKIIAMQFLK